MCIPGLKYITRLITYADLALESEQLGRHWTSKCDAFDPLEGTSTDLDIDSDALFSQYLRSPSRSPSISSTELPSKCSSETLVALDGDNSFLDPPAKLASA